MPNTKCDGFLCELTGVCLSKDRRCDGIPQCKDREDEKGCPINNQGNITHLLIHIILLQILYYYHAFSTIKGEFFQQYLTATKICVVYNDVLF